MEIIGGIALVVAMAAILIVRWDCTPYLRWFFIVITLAVACATMHDIYEAVNGRQIHVCKVHKE